MTTAFQFEVNTRSDSPMPASKRIVDATVTACLSTASEDRSWDGFLQNTPRGQFQQSSLWARCKAIEGWSAIRCVFTIDDRIVGGFQVLWRRTRFGRIGYISKGPVLQSETEGLVELALQWISGVARDLHLAALIIQPPDQSQQFASVLPRHRFQPNYVHEVIKATLLVEVTGGMERVERNMNRSSRKQVRQAKANALKEFI